MGRHAVTTATEAVLLAAGTAAAAGAAGVVAVWLAARRSIRVALVAGPLVVLLCVAAGVLVSARTMFINDHDLGIVLLVLAASVPVALAYGIVLARRVHRLDVAAAEADAARERDAAVEAQRRDLVAWASHDLRTPIAGIRAMAEALSDGVAPPDGAYPARIAAQADRMATMVDHLLALSRIHSGRLRLRLETAGLADLVSDALATARPMAQGAGVALDGRVDDAAVARVDVREMGRVFDNLLSNAVRATPAGGKVAVTARSEPEAVLVRVEDSCGGIPQTERDRMFEAWWRGDRARTPGDDRGAGLGLAVVAGLVQAHGGTVRVEDTPAGCAVEVRLPPA